MIRCLVNVKPCGVAPSPLLRRALAMSFEEDLEGGSMSKRLRNIGKPFRSIGVHRLNSTAVTSNAGEWLHIGDTKVLTLKPKSPELVPTLYAKPPFSQVMLRHLKWMLQKDALGQDMFLIGHPGPSRRHLAMAFCELTQREVEYVSLSRDTTETDLKQRREIINSTVHYVDQSAVRAALEGRVLVLDGIEKAERNVLPVLNNLLENREMQLDDGRLIVAPDRYDALKQEHGERTLERWQISRVDEKFRVIALGLPVPPYKGNPLDPPLRSRFQARTIFQTPFQTLYEELREKYDSIDEKLLSSLLSVSSALHSLPEAHLSGGPVDLSPQIKHIVKNLESIPSISAAELLQTVYPSELLGTDSLLNDALQKFGLTQVKECPLLVDLKPSSNNIQLFFSAGEESSLFQGTRTQSKAYSMEVPGWPERMSEGGQSTDIIPTQSHDMLLAQMLLSHQSADFCLVGGKGSGKTSLVKRFADLLGYEVEPISLYQDMTSRELLQQRATRDNGDTSWSISPLVVAALKGRLAVLDGIHRVDTSTLAVLKSLIQDRSLNLMDGTRFLDLERYQGTKTAANLTDPEMVLRKIFPIDPKFRLIGVGETQKKSSGGGQSGARSPSLASWITPELMSMFHFHHVKSLPIQQEKLIIMKKVPGFNENQLDTTLHFVNSLRSSEDPTLQSLATSFSTRQLLRIAKSLASHPTLSLYEAINKACLSRFIPQMTKSALQQALSSAGILPPGDAQLQRRLQPMKCEIKDGVLRIGETSISVGSGHDAAAMVPNVLFYDNELHLRIIEGMIRDFSLGEHLLLVGNQGVGKNKIVDRFLHLLNLPREYLQLHRDSTVQTLTLQPSVQGGRVTYLDSPLVRALQSGMVLIVDEADKAPTHVTCILKNIVEGSEITLADGRRIVHQHKNKDLDSSSNIFVHPNFRMIVLANRPGFPFLGNDFFASLGDIFSCHAIDNPDLESEKAMLRQYATSIDDSLLTKLVASFSELRQLADEGLIAYPYSTREVVNIVKHMQAYPEDGIGSVVRNVFDFDSYNPDLLEVVMKVLHKHGIPAGASRTNIQLAPQYPLPSPVLEGKWSKMASDAQNLNISRLPVSLKGPFKMKGVSVPVDRIDSRGHVFSEMKTYCALPLHETNHVSAICATNGNDGTQYLQVVTGNPVMLYSLPVHGNLISCVNLDILMSSAGGLGYWKPLPSVIPLTGQHADKFLIHEKKTNALLLVNPHESEVWRVMTSSLARSVKNMVTRRQTSSNDDDYQVCQSGNNTFAIFNKGSSEVDFFDFSGSSPFGWSLSLPSAIDRMFPFSKDQWLLNSVEETGEKRFQVLDFVRTSPVLSGLKVEGKISPDVLKEISKETPSEETFKSGSPELVPLLSYGLIAATVDAKNITALLLKGFPIGEEGTEVYSISKAGLDEDGTTLKFSTGTTTPLVLSSVGEILYPVTMRMASEESNSHTEPGLVVVDLPHKSWRKMILPVSPNTSSVHYHQEPVVQLTALDDSTIAAVDSWGTVRFLETGLFSLKNSLDEWQKMVGDDENKELQVNYSRDSGLDVTSPKHGKVDKENAPHVGGNTWAGGTGGRDTAGLGGKGGPYRLDAGHDVYQLSDEEKKSVPEEVRKKARQMGQKARLERLREIEMSEHDAQMYGEIAGKVRKQVQALRIVLSSIESKNQERQWIRHQTSGDLDERKLIDGITGERSIYKRRGEKEPDFNFEQVYPTYIRLVVDVSGSMYRFNGYDGRLDRTVEAVLMVMEACQKLVNYKVDIVGHSGDSDEIPFVNSASPPSNDKERLQVLKTMIAESQFCWSGDHTIEATRTAIGKVSNTKAEKRYVIVLSDANFSRYGIKPSDFSKLMLSNSLVNVYAIFIGSLGDQATRLKNSLPAGSSYICMENKDLPNILKTILSSISN